MYIIKRCRNGHEIHIHDSGKVTGAMCPWCVLEVVRYYARHGKKVKIHGADRGLP
jgi:hypothetical protein